MSTALIGSALTPGHQQLAVGEYLWSGSCRSRPRRRCRPAGTVPCGCRVERFSAHVERRLARHAELQQNLAVERALAHGMPTVIGENIDVVWRHVNAVGSRILAFAPRAQELALAVEDHHRVLAAIEDVDVVVTVDPDSAHFLERPALRHFRPVGVDPVPKIAAPDDHRNIPSRGCFGLPPV